MYTGLKAKPPGIEHVCMLNTRGGFPSSDNDGIDYFIMENKDCEVVS